MTAATFVVAAFTLRPSCAKCGYDRFGWAYREYVGDSGLEPWINGRPQLPRYAHLHLVCDRCSAAFDMETRDREGTR